MHIFPILETAHHSKHIRVTRYVKTADGVEIRIDHNVPEVKGKELQWVQTVSENGSFYENCKVRTYVDPFGKGGKLSVVSLPSMPGVCKADDALPFYWTAADLKGGSGPGFYDAPSEGAPKTGRTWLNFITALTEVTDTEVHHLAAISWGFDRLADGEVREAAVLRATMPQMRAHGQALKKMYPDYRYT